ncbi:hypothetical protein RF007C_00090 [Ruminococcus flavefaciens 007c]|uniref:Uncharacterized protein n=1 Tax=Ruminococcus flavefaciens 007c TaxID=1341157 RepID=W7V3H6_RUMFL|nr:hypothetical protein RF007C_00090 [Ruminococcus flavefaciens 007c]
MNYRAKPFCGKVLSRSLPDNNEKSPFFRRDFVNNYYYCFCIISIFRKIAS